MYKYTESGLPNVWLSNGYKLHKSEDGDESISITNADGLHAAIGRHIAEKSVITGKEFRFLRKELDLSQNRFASWAGVTEDMVSKWERNGRVPKYACRFMQAIYLEKLDGNVQISELVERLANIDREANTETVFTDTGTCWRMAA